MKGIWVKILLFAFPVLCAVAGRMASVAFATTRLEVRRAGIEWAEVVAPEPDESNEAMAIRRLGMTRDEVRQEAVEAFEAFRLAGTLFGAWCGVVISVKAWTLLKTPERREYVANAGACLACARCFEYCPRERVRRKRRKEDVSES